MKENREDREGAWRIEAPLIGSITIARKVVLRALIVGMLLFTACGGPQRFCGTSMFSGELATGEAETSSAPDPEVRARENARFEEKAALRAGSLHGGVDDIAAEKLRKKEAEGQLDRAVAQEKKIPNADNAGEAMDFIKANLEGKQPEGREPWLAKTILFTNTPERAYERAIERYGEANAQAAYAAWGRTPPSVKAPPAAPAAPPAAAASPGLKFSQGEPPAGDSIEVFRVDNLLRVFNGGTPTSFTMAKDHWVTEVGTYHYNDGKGKAAGTIVLKASDGTTYGPWQAELDQGWYWRAKPNMWLPAGSYTVIDSDPSTWAQNPATGGQGIAWMFGKPAP